MSYLSNCFVHFIFFLFYYIHFQFVVGDICNKKRLDKFINLNKL